MKLLYGEYKFSTTISEPIVVLNFCSLREGLNKLNLMPPNDLSAVSRTEQEFDIAYANWILNNRYQFRAMMSIINTIVENQYWGVYLVIDNDKWIYVVVESFLKFLQARYGVTATSVTTVEDIQYAGDTDIDPRYGIVNYDQDFIRYMDDLEEERIKNGGAPETE